MKMQPGDAVRIRGRILEEVESCRFTVNLGKDDRNIALHFDPRFNHLRDKKKIFMATRKDGEWGHEQRDDNFPFFWGKQVEIMIAFLGDTFEINLSTGHRIVFQNSLKMEILTYMSVVNVAVSDIKFC
ncbi:galectin-1-like [Callorhinchus milii]|uniref:galectin-1-like n=1 Tax=Callorhinchus milii TaxID=7868 RepID=UPI001C3FACE3|nr:galectin-1-like [Callorhinchus milii]